MCVEIKNIITAEITFHFFYDVNMSGKKIFSTNQQEYTQHQNIYNNKDFIFGLQTSLEIV